MIYSYFQQKDQGTYSVKHLEMENISGKLLKTWTKNLHDAKKSFPGGGEYILDMEAVRIRVQ